MACNCNNYQKSTVQSYSTNVIVASGSAIPFNINDVLTGASITHTAGSTTINIIKRGIYKINFNASAKESSTSGNFIVQLYRKGVAVGGALAEAVSSSSSDIENLAFSAIVEVNSVCPCAGIGVSDIPLTIINSGIPTDFIVANVAIEKLA